MAQHLHTLNIVLEVFEHLDDLPESDRYLMDKALIAAQNSWSPYSNFKVGAAVRLANGEIVSGSNQENIAYPSGMCAESICMFSAGAEHPDQAIVALAVTTPSGSDHKDDLLTPCGVCRQVIAEYRSRHDTPIRILMRGHHGAIYVASDIDALLPLMFEHGTLKN